MTLADRAARKLEDLKRRQARADARRTRPPSESCLSSETYPSVSSLGSSQSSSQAVSESSSESVSEGVKSREIGTPSCRSRRPPVGEGARLMVGNHQPGVMDASVTAARGADAGAIPLSATDSGTPPGGKTSPSERVVASSLATETVRGFFGDVEVVGGGVGGGMVEDRRGELRRILEEEGVTLRSHVQKVKECLGAKVTRRLGNGEYGEFLDADAVLRALDQQKALLQEAGLAPVKAEAGGTGQVLRLVRIEADGTRTALEVRG